MGRKVATLRAIRPRPTTSLISGCAQELFALEEDAAGAAARPTSKHARRARGRRRLTPHSSSAHRGAFNLYWMELEITPEPTPDEREALLTALARGSEPQVSAYRSVWRLAGLLENVESDAAAVAPGAAEGSPRSKRGASRA